MTTAGKYVFAPPGTPACPFPTWLTSRDWTNDDFPPWLPHGEYDGERRYSSGRGPGRYPAAVAFGNGDCFAAGEDPANVGPDTVDGFDPRCWLALPVPPDPLLLSLDVTAPDHQRILAQLVQLLYVAPHQAEGLLQQLLGPGSTTALVPNNASEVPGSLIGRQGDLVIVVISGTTNPQQWALQPLTSLTGPVNVGTFSTLPFWYGNALVIQNRLFTFGVPADAKIVLAGHSMGGAIAHIMAGRMVPTVGAGNLQLFTMGTPQPGDQRLADLVRPVTQVNFVNDGDAVTAVPPVGVLLDWLSWLIPGPVSRNWSLWRPPTNRVGLSPGGVRATNPPPTDLFGTVSTLVRQALLFQTPSTVTAHNSDVYLDRLGGPVPPATDVLPGMILPYGGGSVPVGYLPCDGSAVSRTTYADLFAVIGTDYGPGDGSTTFNLPDCRGRVIGGEGSALGGPVRARGTNYGENAHVQLATELAAHTHAVTDPGHTHGITGKATAATAGTSVVQDNAGTAALGVTDSAATGLTVNSSGASAPMNVCQPTCTVKMLIKT